MWYTPLGSRPASAECSRTYLKLVQGEGKSKQLRDVCIFCINGIEVFCGKVI